jgi:hypothetical protein
MLSRLDTYSNEGLVGLSEAIRSRLDNLHNWIGLRDSDAGRFLSKELHAEIDRIRTEYAGVDMAKDGAREAISVLQGREIALKSLLDHLVNLDYVKENLDKELEISLNTLRSRTESNNKPSDIFVAKQGRK